MAKKEFAGGINSLLLSTRDPITENPKKDAISKQLPEDKKLAEPSLRQPENFQTKKAAFQGVRKGATKITFIVDFDVCQKIKALAYYERRELGLYVEQIFTDHLKTHDNRSLEQIFQAWQEEKNKSRKK